MLYINNDIILFIIMTSILNDNDVDKLNEYKIKNGLSENLDECSICCSTFINKFTSCETCKNCICLDCYNKIKQFNLLKIPIENEERGVKFTTKCPFCTNTTTKYLSHFDKEEILNIVSYDYTEYTFKILDNVNEINEVNDENNNLKRLLNYKDNNNNKITNYIIEKQNNEIIKLKKELEDKNNMFKVDIYKFDNNRLLTENMSLKKEINILNSKYNMLVAYFNSIDVLFGIMMDNIKKLCMNGKSKKIDKQLILNETNKKFNLNINLITK